MGNMGITKKSRFLYMFQLSRTDILLDELVLLFMTTYAKLIFIKFSF